MLKCDLNCSGVDCFWLLQRFTIHLSSNNYYNIENVVVLALSVMHPSSWRFGTFLAWSGEILYSVIVFVGIDFSSMMRNYSFSLGYRLSESMWGSFDEVLSGDVEKVWALAFWSLYSSPRMYLFELICTWFDFF